MKKPHEQCETEQKKQTKKQLLRLTSRQTKLLCRQSTPGLHWILAPKRTSHNQQVIWHGLIRCVLVISRDHSWLQSCSRVNAKRIVWGSVQLLEGHKGKVGGHGHVKPGYALPNISQYQICLKYVSSGLVQLPTLKSQPALRKRRRR